MDLEQSIELEVESALASTPAIDVHTHLYDPALGDLLLWGIDELLVYHYLLAEGFRNFQLPYEAFWNLPKSTQANLIWDELFIKHSPLSESCRGVITTLNRLGLDVKHRDLDTLRQWFNLWKPEDFVSRTLEMANVRSVYMSNSPLDDQERHRWDRELTRDDRFLAALRIDPLLLDWPKTALVLVDLGYNVGEGLSPSVLRQVRKFLKDWTERLDAKYLMVSLPPEFTFPCHSECTQLIEETVLPHCQEKGLPLALMMGVRRAVNPKLGMAGDGMGKTDLSALANLCSTYPDNKFLATVLSRENQHELCVLARKFRNLHIFGCWWFTNIPYLVDEITRMRMQMLGTSFTVQHSDARVMDQIIYKWDHTRQILQRILVEHYAELGRSGWRVTPEEIERDARQLLGGAFQDFISTS